ncbi:hypothetical protein FMEAI12_6040009 [Parafrankia sp. Ea1.12]|nr:hypothetical protein FMEAI12_6040009 [Parafrankia sp. Ea1.12]
MSPRVPGITSPGYPNMPTRIGARTARSPAACLAVPGIPPTGAGSRATGARRTETVPALRTSRHRGRHGSGRG